MNGKARSDVSSGNQADITYPLSTVPDLGGGCSVELAPGVLWFRMPVGRELDFINVWAIADHDGWTVVDTGMRNEETVSSWRQASCSALAGKRVSSVLVTHLHPDHSGMAGWLVKRFDARLVMTRLEYLMLRVLASDLGREVPDVALQFYQRAGWDEAALDRYRTRFGDFGKLLYPPPDQFQAIEDGQKLDIGGRSWEVVTGSGHSPEHACLYCPELKMMISGDQILPRISSNVSVHALEPEADPLTDWLTSLARIRSRVPDDVLVLPAHGEPFRGLHARIGALIDGHERTLDRALEALREPKRVTDMFPFLFRRPITPGLVFLATGESLANLHCLRSRGLASVTFDTHGVGWWTAN